MNLDPANERPPVKPFDARRALIVFAANIVVQFMTGFLLFVIAGFFYRYIGGAHSGHGNFRDMVSLVPKAALFPIGMIGMLIGTYTVFRMVRPYFPGSIREGAFAPLGWVRCSTRDLYLATIIGVALAALNVGVLALFPSDAKTLAGPVAIAASSSDWGKYGLMLLAVLIAPPSEEFIFRGVLYTGFARSWGPRVSAIFVSVLFLAIHLPAVIGRLPALFAILGLAIATIVARQRSGSLVAPIGLHMAYNLGVVFFAF